MVAIITELLSGHNFNLKVNMVIVAFKIIKEIVLGQQAEIIVIKMDVKAIA